ncbi:MAG: hypothetical protein AAF639_22295 [Chloroflexota bacterium]
MITDVFEQNLTDVLEYKQNLPAEDVRRRIVLFQLTDDWAADVQKGLLRENHAVLVRSQLNQLCEYYSLADQDEKAELAITLYNTTFFAESEGLTVDQIYLIQLVLTYFLRVELTQDDIKECTLKLYDAGIQILPPMPNFEEFLALSGE